MFFNSAAEKIIILNGKILKKNRTSLVVQWLRLCTPSAGGSGLTPSQGTR